MLTLAIAVGATAGLGLLAMKYPRVQRALSGFTVWAGLFMQVAGVMEAMRRVSINPAGAFAVSPGLPSVGMSGVAQPRPAGPRPIPAADARPVQPNILPKEKADAMAIEQSEVRLAALDPQTVVGDTEWLEQMTKYHHRFIHFDSVGLKDPEANDADPIAQRALAVIRKAEEMVSPTPPPPPPLDASSMRIYDGGQS